MICFAVIPHLKACRTLSREITPKTNLGKRYCISVKIANRAICIAESDHKFMAFSVCTQKLHKLMNTGIGVDPVIGFHYNETRFLRLKFCLFETTDQIYGESGRIESALFSLKNQ